MDPRAKILVTLVLLVWVFLFPGWGSFALLSIVLALAVRIAGVPVTWVTGNLRALYALWFVCFLVNLLLAGGGEPLWRSFSGEALFLGAERGLFFCLRLALVVGIGSLASMTTTPAALGDAVEQGLHAVPGMGSIAGRLALVLVLAWTFVPVLADEAQKIERAQKARGGSWTTGWTGHLLKLRSVFVPLLVGALRSSETLALAMEVRGFAGGGSRTYYRELRFTRTDIAALLLSLAAAAGGGFLWMWEGGL